MRQDIGIPRPVLGAVIRFLAVAEIVVHRSLMEPGPGEQRRREMFLGYGLELSGAVRAGTVILGEAFGVEVLHHAEAAEFALGRSGARGAGKERESSRLRT